MPRDQALSDHQATTAPTASAETGQMNCDQSISVPRKVEIYCPVCKRPAEGWEAYRVTGRVVIWAWCHGQRASFEVEPQRFTFPADSPLR